MSRKLLAELVGTFWLVFGGCGSAVLAAAVFIQQGSSPINIGIGLVGVSLAFGLTVVTMAYAIGHISGCHLNPAVTIGLVAGGRFKAADAAGYVVAQVIGGVLAAGLLMVIAGGKPGFAIDPTSPGHFATNGYGAFSPEKYTMGACFAAEVVLTAIFLFVIMGSTAKAAPAGFAPLAIGLCLALIHLVGIPVTNLSVNPARSTGPAVVVLSRNSSTPLEQLWLFWAAPVVGAVVGAVLYKSVSGEPDETPVS
jgi:aquaporin Z